MAYLLEHAEYGHIPFDLFALEKWEYAQPTENDQGQWNILVKDYLSHPLEQQNIARVLQPHQTIQERNVSALIEFGYTTPLWLRVCYDPDLEDQYNRFLDNCDIEDFFNMEDEQDDMTLDDALLYDAGPSYDRDAILNTMVTRIPSLFDKPRSFHMDPESEVDGEKSALEFAEERAHTFLFVADAEAIKEHMLKIMWLDCYGNCVWNNKIEPCEVAGMCAMFLGGFTLTEAVHGYCQYGNPEGYGKRYSEDLPLITQTRLRLELANKPTS
ncbi:hypothetical protein G7Z17_g8690 [Cylindrodendrum hubeiense]|uniref:Uncharacterized protein n=1 Tax=Cylindrodendrum hubeiense TaxID=595255 RepID=A0A9P5LEG2_9HYPO|nr:hypothetical protein G7Z17_g8690 [Cylindrodendrum hubeiense]